MRKRAMLHHLPHSGHPGCTKEFAQLVQVVWRSVGKGCDQVGALAGATLRPRTVRRAGHGGASVAAALHPGDGTRGQVLSFANTAIRWAPE